jgi:pilus assembly protein Flp/PilA
LLQTAPTLRQAQGERIFSSYDDCVAVSSKCNRPICLTYTPFPVDRTEKDAVNARQPAVLTPSQLPHPNSAVNRGLDAAGEGKWSPDVEPIFRRPEMAKFLKLIKNDKGATAIEYGLIAALIAVAAITAMTSIGSKLGSTFNNVSSNLK